MEVDINRDGLNELLNAILAKYGYDFNDYSESSVKRRITHFMYNHKIHSLPALQQHLLADEHLFIRFIQYISVTVTEMFRDPTFYISLREIVMKRLATYPFIKIWIAGCATGEEAYSVAIMLKEEELLSRSIIYATDINQKSLQIAKDGVYTLNNMKKNSTNYILAQGKSSFSEYYKAKYDSVMFDKSLRENIVFSTHNLAVDTSFNEFQLIICRNVLIYFNQKLQSRVIDLFYESLCAFGFLALGNKESLLFSGKRQLFEEKDKKERIYMKIK